MTSTVYRTYLLDIHLLTSGTYQWLLTGDGYVPDTDADVFVADTSDEYGGGSYARQAFSYDSTDTLAAKKVIVVASMPSFVLDNDSIHLANLVLAEDSGVDASDRLVARFGIDKSGDGTTYTPVAPSDRIIAVTSTEDLSDLTPPGPGELAPAVARVDASHVRAIESAGVGYATTPRQRQAAARTPPEPTPHPIPGVPWLVGHGGYRPPA